MICHSHNLEFYTQLETDIGFSLLYFWNFECNTDFWSSNDKTFTIEIQICSRIFYNFRRNTLTALIVQGFDSEVKETYQFVEFTKKSCLGENIFDSILVAVKTLVLIVIVKYVWTFFFMEQHF
jgi:hypothetical protein